jgi:O-antigen/teichoic acid export membrane protein
LSKAVGIARVSAKGSFHLFWGMVASTIISAVGTIFVARLLSPSEYGLYAIALTVPILISNFRDWGVNAAMVRYAAQYNSESQTAKVKSILFSGLVFETVLGLLLSVLSFLLSGFVATSGFQRPGLTPLIQIASFIILTGALLNTAQAAFTGIEKMELNSITLICQSTIRAIIIPILVIFGLGAFGAVIGYTIAFLIAGLVGILLMWILIKSLPKQTATKMEIWANMKTMFKYGLPLSIAAILSGFLTQFYTFIIAIYATDSMIGNYTLANSFVVLITFFATPITTMLFPVFSKLDPKKDQETLKNIFQFSVKYAALLVVPAATIVMTLSQPAVSTLFGDKYTTAPLFLALLAITYLYSALGSLSAGNLINGQGETQFNLKLTLLTAAIGFPLGFILIWQFGILGLIAASLTAGIPSLLISLHWLEKRNGVTVDWISSAKILISSAIAAAITYALISQLSFSSWVTLIIGVVIFLLVFITAILRTKTIDRSDINNLRGMLSGFGPIYSLFDFLLNIIEKLLTILRV